jgi:hypothetical protein
LHSPTTVGPGRIAPVLLAPEEPANMRHQHQPTTVVAILDTDALAEDIRARFLEREGYSVRH